MADDAHHAAAEVRCQFADADAAVIALVDEKGEQHGLDRSQPHLPAYVADVAVSVLEKLLAQAGAFRTFHNLFDGRQQVQLLWFLHGLLFLCQVFAFAELSHLSLCFELRCKDEAMLCRNAA